MALLLCTTASRGYGVIGAYSQPGIGFNHAIIL
jgi:hypothetical protein